MMKQLLLAAFGLCMAWGGAMADESPKISGPIRIVVPFAAGGGAIDLSARAIQQSLSNRLGVSVIVDNRPGGGTSVGTQHVMNAPADGRTLILMSDPGWVGYYHSGLMNFKPWEILTPIAQVSQSPYTVLTVSAASGIGSWSALIQKVKKEKRPLAGAAPAAGGFSEMTFNELVERAGTGGIFVPYAGAGQARVGLLRGDVDFQIESGQAFVGIRSGVTRGIAISTAERFPFAPDIPTFQELGIMDTLPTNTYSMWGPPNMSPALVRLLSDALQAVTKEPGVVEVHGRSAIEVRFRTGDEVRRNTEDVNRVWGPRLATVKAAYRAQAKGSGGK